MISPEDMEHTCSRDEKCIYASFELPIFFSNDGNNVYNTCKFRHKCTLWIIMSLYNKKHYKIK